MDNLVLDHGEARQAIGRQIDDLLNDNPGLARKKSITINGHAAATGKVDANLVEQYLSLLNETIELDLRAMEELQNISCTEEEQTQKFNIAVSCWSLACGNLQRLEAELGRWEDDEDDEYKQLGTSWQRMYDVQNERCKRLMRVFGI